MNIVETNRLVKKYKDNVAVNEIDLAVKEGEIFGLLGPNGAGKTTLISMIVGILKVTNGTIKIFDKELSKEGKSVKKNIGYVPQELAFFEHLSAYDNVLYWGRLYGLKGDELKKGAQEALKYTGLNERKKEESKKFSGGMKHRLNIACAIVHKPKLLFMDEPTVGVDPQSRNNILESIKELNKSGTTVVYTSHYMEEVEEICDRVGIMDFGKIVALGTIDELIASTIKDECVYIQLNHIDDALIRLIKRVNGVISCEQYKDSLVVHVNPANINTIQLVEKLISDKVEIKALNMEKPNLETVFLSLTGKKLRD